MGSYNENVKMILVRTDQVKTVISGRKWDGVKITMERIPRIPKKLGGTFRQSQTAYKLFLIPKVRCNLTFISSLLHIHI